MYAQYWGLTETPFRSTPDRRWFYEGPGHEEALARLFFVVEQSRPCGVLIGRQGTGKTLLMDVLRAELLRTQRELALVDLVGRNQRDLLWELAATLRLGPGRDETTRGLWRMLQDHLQSNSSAQIQTVLIFDHFERAEADCPRTLERLFQIQTGFPTLVTFLLAVRDEKAAHSGRLISELSDLRIELAPLDRGQTEFYIDTLLAKAGRQQPIFEVEAMDRLYELTHGIPRDLNRLCDLSLLAAMSDGETQVNANIVIAAAEELHLIRSPASRIGAWTHERDISRYEEV